MILQQNQPQKEPRQDNSSIIIRPLDIIQKGQEISSAWFKNTITSGYPEEKKEIHNKKNPPKK